MSRVTVIFTRKHHIGSVLLRWWMHSRFSHCAFVTPEGTVIEAAAGGVKERLLEDFIREQSKMELIQIPCEDPDKVLALARAQVGKGYDWWGILGFWFRRKLQRDDAFVCSELIAWCFQEAGYPLFRRQAWRINPEMLYLPRY